MTVTLHDLENIVQFIDSMAERGAIKGSELAQTGEIREKIRIFVEVSKSEAQVEPMSELLTEG